MAVVSREAGAIPHQCLSMFNPVVTNLRALHTFRYRVINFWMKALRFATGTGSETLLKELFRSRWESWDCREIR